MDARARLTSHSTRRVYQLLAKQIGPALLGVAAGLGFEPWNWWPVSIGALALLMYITNSQARSRDAGLTAGIFGICLNATTLSWIGDAFQFQQAMPVQLAPFAVAALSAYLALYWSAALSLAHRVARRDPIAFACATAGFFVLGEWLRGILFTGFGWNPLGAIWLPMPAIARGAAAAGALGLSGLTILFAGLLAAVARKRLGPAAALISLSVAVLLLSPQQTVPPDTAQDIVIVQANINQSHKWREAFAESNLEKYLRITARPEAGSPPRQIFWPEAAVTEPLGQNAELRSRLAAHLQPGDLLVTGGVGFAVNGHPTNSVFVINADGTIVDRYDKRHLVPFGEYLPLRSISAAFGLAKFVPGSADFTPGNKLPELAVRNLKAGVAICYEISFAGEVLSHGTRPAFIFNPSNDSWFGANGPPQHLAQARLRAIELGIPVIRATQTGISAVIRADGSISASLPANRAARLDTKLPAPLPPTFFARFGDIVPLSAAVTALIAALWFRRDFAHG